MSIFQNRIRIPALRVNPCRINTKAECVGGAVTPVQEITRSVYITPEYTQINITTPSDPNRLSAPIWTPPTFWSKTRLTSLLMRVPLPKPLIQIPHWLIGGAIGGGAICFDLRPHPSLPLIVLNLRKLERARPGCQAAVLPSAQPKSAYPRNKAESWTNRCRWRRWPY